MAKSRTKPNGGSGKISDERLHGIVKELKIANEAVDDVKQSVSDILETAKGVGIHTGALKAAMRLAKKDPAEQNDFLLWFERLCELLQVGKQREMFGEESNVVAMPQ
jgi:uncharacterized protein (UPF0335 family)